MYLSLCWPLELSVGFLIIKHAGMVTKMEYHAALPYIPPNSGKHDLLHLRLKIFSVSAKN